MRSSTGPFVGRERQLAELRAKLGVGNRTEAAVAHREGLIG